MELRYKPCLCKRNQIPIHLKYCNFCRPNDNYITSGKPKVEVKDYKYYQEKDKNQIDLKTHVLNR